MLAASDAPDDQTQAHRLLQQVLQQDPDNLHAHSTLAQLAIRRGDWPQALEHAQQGLRIDPGNQASAVLLATTYARRNEPDDLQTAIDHLQRFVTDYPGNLKAEDYLRRLRQRQQLAARGQQQPHEDDEAPASADTAPSEADPAWRTFAESIRSWVAVSTAGVEPASAGEDVILVDRVLPLPQALRQAVIHSLWNFDVLDRYDTAARQEFPLEMRLWRYLQTLQPASSSGSERERAKQDLQTWREAETHASTQDSSSWLPFLNKQLNALTAPADAARASGAEWLMNLLDRYQPLPAPLFV